MKTRLLAGFIGLAFLIPGMIWGGELAVEIAIPIAILIALAEYAVMAFPADVRFALAWLVSGTGLLYTALVYAPQQIHLAFLIVTIGTLIFVTLRPGPDLSRGADNVGRYLVGFLWIAMLGFFVLLRRLDGGLAWIFLVLVIAWAGDTGAYFSGRFLGRHKLYPRVSPKKTWEGVAGGVTAATVGVFIVSFFYTALRPLDCVLLGVVLCLAGVLGDLAESLIKRSHQVKDSGWIMPGHGGLLDRIDSVLFVAPLLYGYVVLVME
ncbi:MAG: phosphatidate cytidylyltransferase [Proteobacteria bacterium]|nr:phosphatidate cytidylyltransferase [Pseudomonadota bacterium]